MCGIYNILNNKKNNYILTIGAVGLILTHLIVTMYTALFASVYLIVNYKKLKNIQIIKKLLINILLILIITSFFWMPLLEHKLNANYEVFKEGRMERQDVLIAYKLNFTELFFTNSNNYMIYEIGFLNIIALILTPIAFKKIKKTAIYKTYLFCLISAIVCQIMTLKIFPFENLPSVLKMIQFSFRLLEFSSFFLSLVVAININILIPKKIKKMDIIIVLIILMISSMFYIGHLHYLDEPFDEMKLYPAVRVTKDTGRVHAGLASFEYLPCNAFENRQYLENRSKDVLILSGDGDISDQEKNLSKMNFDIANVTKDTVLELPYIYYLGYNAYLEEDGKIIKIDTEESENGFVQIKVNNIDNAKINICYEGTLIMNLSKNISVIGLIVLIILFIKRIPRKIKE